MATHSRALSLVAKLRDPRNSSTMVGGQLPFFKKFLNNARSQNLARRHKQNMKFIQILFALKHLDQNTQRMIINQLNLPHKTVIKAPPAPRLAPSTMNPLRGTKPKNPSGRRHRKVTPLHEPR